MLGRHGEDASHRRKSVQVADQFTAADIEDHKLTGAHV
jgi:hypothetical protein